MSVYVDNAKHRVGRMYMCHMVADTDEELEEMTRKIGVDFKHAHYSNKGLLHMNICMAKRPLAIKYGAIQISRRELATFIRSKRANSL